MGKADLVDVTKEYTTQEAAKIAGVDPSYLRRILGTTRRTGYGVLKGRNVEGRVWLISGASLKRWLELRELAG